jgi:hypothetical protein
MMEVAFHNLWLSLSTPQVRAQVRQHFWLVMRSSASHGIALHILVQILIGIQLWAARWQRKYPNPAAVLFDPAFDSRRLMHRMPVQNQEYLPRRLPKQSSQKPKKHGCA